MKLTKNLKILLALTLLIMSILITGLTIYWVQDRSKVEVVEFEGVSDDIKILIYEGEEFIAETSPSSSVKLQEGNYSLVAIDDQYENEIANQDFEVNSGRDDMTVEVLEAEYLDDVTIQVETEEEFVSPVLGCENVEFLRGVFDWHHGVDYSQPGGCWINAIAEGEVINAGWGSRGEGFNVRIQHEDGMISEYHHGNGEFKVKVGDRVSVGQEIMYMGCTGFCTDEHLHLEIRLDGDVVDPLDLYGEDN